jgi:hypothetical protein
VLAAGETVMALVVAPPGAQR